MKTSSLLPISSLSVLRLCHESLVKFIELVTMMTQNKGPWYLSMRQMEACQKSFTAQKGNRMCFRGEDEGRAELSWKGGRASREERGKKKSFVQSGLCENIVRNHGGFFVTGLCL
ncbi:hypothetical protein I3760_11G159800 [Carya illinoinensis]|nr:hypothetical protein I3760_11G159800 [Carya illinoinensis]